MKAIVHLSDIHVTKKKRYQGDTLREVFKRVAKNMVESSLLAPNNTAVVITGDIVQRVKEGDYEIAKQGIDNLSSAGFEILIVPGNHDYCLPLWKRASARQTKKYHVDNIEYFYRYFSDYLFRDELFNNGTHERKFPDLLILDENTSESIALIGLNSMEGRFETTDEVTSAKGRFSVNQLRRLDALLSEDRVKNCAKRVLCFHHHLFDEDDNPAVDEWETLHEVVRNHQDLGTSADAMLYGHKHSGKIDIKLSNDWNIPRCYDGGSSTGRSGKIIQRVIDLSKPLETDQEGNFHL